MTYQTHKYKIACFSVLYCIYLSFDKLFHSYIYKYVAYSYNWRA